MNAPAPVTAPLHRVVQLPTGTLELDVHEQEYPLDSVLGFAARANARRGFLLLSKVLGKHWPSRPRAMTRVHRRLAAGVPSLAGPVLFVALAETAVGLGHGVFEEWLRTHPGREALFLHSTRHLAGDGPRIEFEESHSHAPRQFLHVPDEPHKLDLLQRATTLVLLDDEATSGATFVNVATACRQFNRTLGHVHMAVIANFMGRTRTASVEGHIGLRCTVDALVGGELRFTSGAIAAAQEPAQHVGSGQATAPGRFGRLGLTRPLAMPLRLAAALADATPDGHRTLVLGTGEFMHGAFLLGRALERLGLDVVVQSTTRSPILAGGAVSHVLTFPDTYREGIRYYLYNVKPGQYDKVLICHETVADHALQELASRLDARTYYFRDEDAIADLS